jgi:hypothetical protein
MTATAWGSGWSECTDRLLHLWPHRQQDEDLDQLGESVTRIGHLGLTIHEELNQQASTPCFSLQCLSAVRRAQEQVQACCTLRRLCLCGSGVVLSQTSSADRWLCWMARCQGRRYSQQLLTRVYSVTLLTAIVLLPGHDAG